MNKSESIKELTAALVKFQGEVSNPKNSTENPLFKTKYAPLSDILTLVRPLLAKYGLSVIQIPSGDGEKITITTILLHESGEWIESEPLVIRPEKNKPQSIGSAVSYGRRYSISAMLNISSEGTDDGIEVTHGSVNPHSKQSSPTKIAIANQPPQPQLGAQKDQHQQSQSRPQSQNTNSQQMQPQNQQQNGRNVKANANQVNAIQSLAYKKNKQDVVDNFYCENNTDSSNLTAHQANQLIRLLQER